MKIAKGTDRYSDYMKYQWKYKKKNYYTLTINLRYDKDIALIYDLDQFEGNKAEWVKRVLTNALVREGRHHTDVDLTNWTPSGRHRE